MMDHYTSALGHLLFLQTQPEFVPTSHNINLEHLFLANSQETKDTVDDLRRVKARALKSFEIIKESMRNFDAHKTRIKEIEPYLPNLEKEYQKILIGNLVNRNLTKIAKRLIESYIQQTTEDKEKESIFYRQLGIFLNEHQNQLTENIGITTPKIDNMISKALENGAFGAKINGSGFGGCIFLLAPENKEGVMDAIKDAGGVVYDIETAEGVRFY
jgi:galactokinase